MLSKSIKVSFFFYKKSITVTVNSWRHYWPEIISYFFETFICTVHEIPKIVCLDMQPKLQTNGIARLWSFIDKLLLRFCLNQIEITAFYLVKKNQFNELFFIFLTLGLTGRADIRSFALRRHNWKRIHAWKLRSYHEKGLKEIFSMGFYM